MYIVLKLNKIWQALKVHHKTVYIECIAGCLIPSYVICNMNMTFLTSHRRNTKCCSAITSQNVPAQHSTPPPHKHTHRTTAFNRSVDIRNYDFGPTTARTHTHTHTPLYTIAVLMILTPPYWKFYRNWFCVKLQQAIRWSFLVSTHSTISYIDSIVVGISFTAFRRQKNK